MSKWQPENVASFAVNVQVARHGGGWKVRVFVRYLNKTGFVEIKEPYEVWPRKRDAEKFARKVGRELFPLIGAVFTIAMRRAERRTGPVPAFAYLKERS